ncbi:hypothetical protein MMC20_006771 [Loxospora ochrophaea]|nr:hypothetical protein [Loxospora ochrophaea]
MTAQHSLMALPSPLQPQDDDGLTDEEIKKLLKDAEDRLRACPPSSAAVASRPLLTRGTAATPSAKLTKLHIGNIAQPYVASRGGIARADATRLLDDRERQLAGKFQNVEDPTTAKQKSYAAKKVTAGSDWFYIPRTDLTSELKRDLQLLRMRSVLDPKRHYKKDDRKGQIPTYSQVGTILEGPTEYYSSRLLNRDRMQSFVDEVLAGENLTGRFKSKYEDIQSTKRSGKKAYYKALKEKRMRAQRRH